ncbi:MAG: ABC transporter ATP-binding protein, partial [Cyanobacteria bacterium J06633_1]
MKKIIRNLGSPAGLLVVQTARQNWWLIAMNLGTNVLAAILEGSTLGVIYLAIAYLTEDIQTPKGEGNSALMQKLSTLLPLPPEQMFLALICGAVILQVGLSISNYVNRVTTSYLSAKAQPYVTSKVFERIMTFSYGCVSRYKVGDLVMFSNDASSAVDRQITEINN